MKIQAPIKTFFNFEDSALYGKKVKRLEGKFEKLYFRLLYCKVDIWKSSLCRTRRYLIESLGNNNFGNFLSLPPVSIEILFENKHWQFSGLKPFQIINKMIIKFEIEKVHRISLWQAKTIVQIFQKIEFCWRFWGFKRLNLDQQIFFSLSASSRLISSKTMPHTEFSWNNPLWGSTWGQIFYLGESAQAFFFKL